MNKRKTTNTLLLILVIPLIFYILKTLSFIFIPLLSSMFIALLFLPLTRWFKKKGLPKALSITTVVIIILVFFKLTGELIHISSQQILASDSSFFDKAKDKLTSLIIGIESFFGIDFLKGEVVFSSFIQKDAILSNLVPTVGYISDTLSTLLITLFFVLLLLSDSVDIQKVLSKVVLSTKNFTSIKIFMKIEKSLIKFIKVKFFISLLTGVFTGIACWAFGISFPIFWGLFAFIINFLQMIGSVITVVLLSIFAFVEVESISLLIFFSLTITGVQVLFGAILEPIFMGKSFSINVITIVIMLMLWGYIWGIPGLIMSVPITVFLKILYTNIYKKTDPVL